MRLRILCFHAFRLSGEAMRKQMNTFSNFEPLLADIADFEYIDGAHRLSDEEAQALPERLRKLFPPPYHEWWNARETPDGVVYDHMDASIELIARHVVSKGPFDGYLGFSQGGSVAHLLRAGRVEKQHEGPPRTARDVHEVRHC